MSFHGLVIFSASFAPISLAISFLLCIKPMPCAFSLSSRRCFSSSRVRFFSDWSPDFFASSYALRAADTFSSW